MDTRLAGEPTAVLLGSLLHLKRLRFCNLFFYLIKVEMWPGILYYSADTSFVICRAARLLSLLTDSGTTWWIDKITVRALGPYKLPRSSGDADFVRAGKLHSVKLRPFNIRRWCLVQNALAADLPGASKLRGDFLLIEHFQTIQMCWISCASLYMYFLHKYGGCPQPWET